MTRHALAQAPAALFGALGDATRLSLLSRLCASGPLSISQLTCGLGISRQAVTKHLRLLEACGLARGTRAGRERLFEFQPGAAELARAWLEGAVRAWDRPPVRKGTALSSR